ncbi:MAG TPA: hypothetical protein PKD83_09825 [Ignavibacteria bacterium]|nr:hypothetical protein [Ignavibacteria bacterium]
MITRKSRDVKFIIYQSLYIFVISVLALKGANLDLTAVVSKDKVVEKKYTDSLRVMIDSLLARGIIPEIKFDTSQRFTDPEELKKKLAEAQIQLNVLKNTSPSFSVNQTTPNVSVQQDQQQIQKENVTEQKKEEDKTEADNNQNLDFRISQTFTQYTTNTVSNPGTTAIEIYGSDGSMIGSVPPGGSKSFQLGGQSSLTFKRGGVSRSVSTKENSKPKISMQRLVGAGEDVSVRSLQSTVGYRVTISDDFPGQLDVKFSGPVTVKEAGKLVYDVTLNAFNSKAVFDNFSESREAPFSVSFQVNVKDNIATQHNVSQSGVFQFGEW